MTANNKDGSPSVGKRFNNPGNVRCLLTNNPYHGQCRKVRGNGYFEEFPTQEQGIYANVDLYVRMYMGLDPDEMTWKWARAKSGAYYDSLRSCFK